MAQPEWRAPPAPREEVRARLPNLNVYNSLTRSKTPFIPLDPEGKKIGWYSCGPTVYDDSHLGHARNYVTADIIRRILQDYFQFRVHFVMNITDIDDKIILAARQQHLFSQWLAKHNEVDADVRETTRKAFEAYLGKNLPLMSLSTDSKTFAEEAERKYGHVLEGKSAANDESPAGDKEAKIRMHLNTARSAAEAQQMSNPALDEFAAKASGVLLPYIDSLESTTVKGKDHEIFTKLTRRYEQRFFEDMKALNVREPDVLTRATEYCPQIVEFVKRIQDNGFAYEHEGSMYYDIGAWEASGGHYARLEPWSRNDRELQADGEGSLATKKTGFKRTGADFALWKASRPGEPSWSSPWGEGRPGWHIECSAMASDVLGKHFDIHSGGIDLAFPHHDNEIAQAESYWCTPGKGSDTEQWVNYFLHLGHLSISGSKMSKSLKNFTTIREALSEHAWTPRGLRVVFLLGSWKDGLEITPELVKAGIAWEERVTNFFIRVRDAQQRNSSVQMNGSANDANGSTVDMNQKLESAKIKFCDALCDSFDTPSAMRIISELITTFNSEKHVPLWITLDIGRWITDMVFIFGLDAEARRSGQIGWSGIDIPDRAKPFIHPLAQLRDIVREQAIAGQINISELGRMEDRDTTYSSNQPYANANADFQRKIVQLHRQGAAPKEYLAACDYVRDTVLWNLDIYLEDREAQPALVRPLSPSLRQERKDREAIQASKVTAREKAKADAETAEKEKLEKGKLSHLEMFRTTEYSEWDADGLPTKDAEGNEVAKNRSKKLRKDWERQKKLHEAYQASSNQA